MEKKSTSHREKITFRTENSDGLKEQPTTMHLLPFNFTKYNGPARVSSFFEMNERKMDLPPRNEEEKEGKSYTQYEMLLIWL